MIPQCQYIPDHDFASFQSLLIIDFRILALAAHCYRSRNLQRKFNKIYFFCLIFRESVRSYFDAANVSISSVLNRVDNSVRRKFRVSEIDLNHILELLKHQCKCGFLAHGYILLNLLLPQLSKVKIKKPTSWFQFYKFLSWKLSKFFTAFYFNAEKPTVFGQSFFMSIKKYSLESLFKNISWLFSRKEARA